MSYYECVLIISVTMIYLTVLHHAIAKNLAGFLEADYKVSCSVPGYHSTASMASTNSSPIKNPLLPPPHLPSQESPSPKKPNLSSIPGRVRIQLECLHRSGSGCALRSTRIKFPMVGVQKCEGDRCLIAVMNSPASP